MTFSEVSVKRITKSTYKSAASEIRQLLCDFTLLESQIMGNWDILIINRGICKDNLSLLTEFRSFKFPERLYMIKRECIIWIPVTRSIFISEQNDLF